MSAMKEILELHPTAKEMQNLGVVAYIEQAMQDHPGANCVKVVAPAEWKEKLAQNTSPSDKQLDLAITSPCTQQTVGKEGAYQLKVVQGAESNLRKFSAEYQQGASTKLAMLSESAGSRDMQRVYWENLDSLSAEYGLEVQGSIFGEADVAWNINADLLNVLSALEVEIPRLNSSCLHVTQMFSTVAWHVEDKDLFAVNYHHSGESKRWYSIPAAYRQRFEELAQSLFPKESLACKYFLRHRATMISPELIQQAGIPIETTLQKPGEFIFNMPHSYNCSFSHGFSYAESVNFATPQWFPMGRDATVCGCKKDTVDINVEELAERYCCLLQASCGQQVGSDNPVDTLAKLRWSDVMKSLEQYGQMVKAGGDTNDSEKPDEPNASAHNAAEDKPKPAAEAGISSQEGSAFKTGSAFKAVKRTPIPEADLPATVKHEMGEATKSAFRPSGSAFTRVEAHLKDDGADHFVRRTGGSEQRFPDEIQYPMKRKPRVSEFENPVDLKKMRNMTDSHQAAAYYQGIPTGNLVGQQQGMTTIISQPDGHSKEQYQTAAARDEAAANLKQMTGMSHKPAGTHGKDLASYPPQQPGAPQQEQSNQMHLKHLLVQHHNHIAASHAFEPVMKHENNVEQYSSKLRPQQGQQGHPHTHQYNAHAMARQHPGNGMANQIKSQTNQQVATSYPQVAVQNTFPPSAYPIQTSYPPPMARDQDLRTLHAESIRSNEHRMNFSAAAAGIRENGMIAGYSNAQQRGQQMHHSNMAQPYHNQVYAPTRDNEIKSPYGTASYGPQSHMTPQHVLAYQQVATRMYGNGEVVESEQQPSFSNVQQSMQSARHVPLQPCHTTTLAYPPNGMQQMNAPKIVSQRLMPTPRTYTRSDPVKGMKKPCSACIAEHGMEHPLDMKYVPLKKFLRSQVQIPFSAIKQCQCLKDLHAVYQKFPSCHPAFQQCSHDKTVES